MRHREIGVVDTVPYPGPSHLPRYWTHFPLKGHQPGDLYKSFASRIWYMYMGHENWKPLEDEEEVEKWLTLSELSINYTTQGQTKHPS